MDSEVFMSAILVHWPGELNPSRKVLTLQYHINWSTVLNSSPKEMIVS